MKKVALLLVFFLIFGILSAQDAETKEAAEALPAVEAPETILLKNGDKITAFVQDFDMEDNSLKLKNEEIGEFTVHWDHIQGINSERILFFRMENGNVVSGKAIWESNHQVINSPLVGKIKVRRDQIRIIAVTEKGVSPEYNDLMTKYEETKEALRKTSEIGEIWSGYLEAHLSGNEGNKNELSFTGVAHMERKTEIERFAAHIDARYTESRRVRTTNQIEGYLKEDLDISESIYVWGQLSGKWDDINGIDLRFRAELGFGVHVVRPGTWDVFGGDEITLRWELGAQFTNTDYRTSQDTHTGGSVTRILYRHLFVPFEEEGAKPWTLEITGEYYQSFVEPQNKTNAGDLDDYTFKGIIGLTIPVSGVVSFTARIWDEYNNVTDSADQRRNDFYWDFGIRVSL